MPIKSGKKTLQQRKLYTASFHRRQKKLTKNEHPKS